MGPESWVHGTLRQAPIKNASPLALGGSCLTFSFYFPYPLLYLRFAQGV